MKEAVDKEILHNREISMKSVFDRENIKKKFKLLLQKSLPSLKNEITEQIKWIDKEEKKVIKKSKML